MLGLSTAMLSNIFSKLLQLRRKWLLNWFSHLNRLKVINSATEQILAGNVTDGELVFEQLPRGASHPQKKIRN
jgi:hypothetical protein